MGYQKSKALSTRFGGFRYRSTHPTLATLALESKPLDLEVSDI
jgi:hypothetical protein